MKKFILILAVAAVCAALLLLPRFAGERRYEIEKNASVLAKEDITYLSGQFEESTALFSNPFCGFYHIYGFVLKDEAVYASPEDVPTHDDTDERLVLLQFNLCRFADAPLTQTALSQLDIILDAYTACGKQLILRFLYDWDGNGLQSEPESRETILTHIRQVARVCNKYRDRIFIVQGLFTGSYGEMHTTSYSSAQDLQALFHALEDSVEEPVYFAVRRPAHWRAVFGAQSASPEELSNLLPGCRLGLYNDGMLASPTDLGTYGDNMRDSELSFQDTLCQLVPNGGEILFDNPYNDLANAIADLSRMHVSYLNSAYDTAVYEKWKNTVYRSDDCYDGMNGYDYILCHLGYRYVLRDTSFSSGRLALTIENVGFAPSYRPVSLKLTLLSKDGRKAGEYLLPSAEKELPGCSTSELSLPLCTDALSPGSYELFLTAFSDDTGETIPFANTLTPSEDGCPIGSLTIHRFPDNVPKKIRPSRYSPAR